MKNLSRRPSLAVVALLLAGCGGGGGGGKDSNSNPGSGPTITTQPADVSVAAGGTATFTVAANGATAYQWYKGSSAVAGATSATLTLPNVTAASAGTYFCRVSDGNGATDSRKATLAVAAVGAPTITTQPKNLTVAPGGEALFSVVATGDGTLAYQWYKGSSAIQDATEASYRIANVSSVSAGSFTVRVSNASGNVTSAPATLTVASTNGPVITNQPDSLNVGTGRRAVFSVTATGANLTYQWRKGGVPISGATSAVYAIAAASAADAGEYDVVVTNANGSATSAVATLTVATVPVITAGPTNQTVYATATVTFTVAASGANLTYQWYKGAVPISGATSSTYTIARTTVNDAATYAVVVTNVAGSTRSDGAVLTVLGRPVIVTQPVAATVGVGDTATFSVGATGSGLLYQWTKDESKIAGATSATYTTPALTLADSGVKYACVVANPAGTLLTDSVVLTVVAKPTITTQPTSKTVVAPATATFTVAATVPSGGALSYAWYRVGSATVLGTDASYTTPATDGTYNGAQYYCVVKNRNVAPVNSATVTLTVN